jgi:hypothetical protein
MISIYKNILGNLPFVIILLLLPVMGFTKEVRRPVTKPVNPSAPGAPHAPSNLTAQLFIILTTMQARLGWIDNSTDEDGFIIERRMDAGIWQGLDEVHSNVTTYSDLLLVPGHTFCYRVYAYSSTGGGISGNSNDACVTTPEILPNTPTNLVAQKMSPTQNHISWQDNSNNEAGFGIEYHPSSTVWSLLTTVQTNITSFYHYDLNPNETYCYRVYAYNTVGQSNYSNESCTGFFSIPSGIRNQYWMKLETNP